MANRSVTLTKNQEEIVDTLVASGRYRDADEVIGEALSLFEVREHDDILKLQNLRLAASVGVADFERGAFVEFSDGRALADHLNQVSARALTLSEDH